MNWKERIGWIILGIILSMCLSILFHYIQDLKEENEYLDGALDRCWDKAERYYVQLRSCRCEIEGVDCGNTIMFWINLTEGDSTIREANFSLKG